MKYRLLFIIICVILLFSFVCLQAEALSLSRKAYQYYGKTVENTQEPSESPVASLTSTASELIAQVNAERIRYGLNPLRTDADLTTAACIRGGEITRKFSHTRPDGSSWSSVSGKAKGENIAMGYSNVDKVMAAWLTSEGHRANILRNSFTSIGVCVYQYNGIFYWVQLFGRD